MTKTLLKTATSKWGRAAATLTIAGWRRALLALFVLGITGCDAEQATRPTLVPPVEAVAMTPPTSASSSPSMDSAPCSNQGLSEASRSMLPALATAPGRIAFVCKGQIWTMRPDGSGHRGVTAPSAIDFARVRLHREPVHQPLTAPEIEKLQEEMDSAPVWLADGRIVFSSSRDTLALSAAAGPAQPRYFVGATELYVINADGTGLRRLTDYNLTPGSYPSLYQPGYRPAECPDPASCTAGRVRLTPMAASPVGPTIVVDVAELRQSECCRYSMFLDVDTGSARRTRFLVAEVDPRRREIVGTTIEAGISWSPDGTLAVVLHRDLVLQAPRFEDISIHNLASGEQRLLAWAGDDAAWGWLSAPAWSPDGQTIAFCGARRYDQPGTVYLLSALGGMARPLFALQEPCAAPGWSPDGKLLVLGTRQGIMVVEPAAGQSAIISSGAQPVWGSLLGAGK